MALSPGAAALKEQALHNADAILRANDADADPGVRLLLGMAYLNGFEDGTAGMGAALADVRRWLMDAR